AGEGKEDARRRSGADREKTGQSRVRHQGAGESGRGRESETQGLCGQKRQGDRPHRRIEGLTMNQDSRGEAFQTVQEAVAWITGLVSFGIKPGLKRMEELAGRLGHPERRLRFIHVAGTNGKGSTCAM